jgi:membrane associated rhomboid family serine protease
MAIASFSPPKDWEDWATLLLGLWLWVSPVLTGFEDAAASPHFYVVGFLVIVCELFAFYFFRTWEEWINIVLGLWLIIAALSLFTARAAQIDAIVIGLLLVALSAYEMWEDRRHTDVEA